VRHVVIEVGTKTGRDLALDIKQRLQPWPVGGRGKSQHEFATRGTGVVQLWRHSAGLRNAQR
jgi:hypothetical protein